MTMASELIGVAIRRSRVCFSRSRLMAQLSRPVPGRPPERHQHQQGAEDAPPDLPSRQRRRATEAVAKSGLEEQLDHQANPPSSTR